MRDLSVTPSLVYMRTADLHSLRCRTGSARGNVDAETAAYVETQPFLNGDVVVNTALCCAAIVALTRMERLLSH